ATVLTDSQRHYHLLAGERCRVNEQRAEFHFVQSPLHHLVWSRNSCDPWVVILEKAAESLSTSNRWSTYLAELVGTGEQQSVPLALVIPFTTIMFCELS